MLKRSSAPCGCDVAVAVLAALGAKHAARMHEGSAAREPARWPVRDWGMHMLEEERYFIPVVARMDPRAAREMIDDHEVFRYELSRYGEIRDLARMRRHSRAEDRFAERMVAQGLVRI